MPWTVSDVDEHKKGLTPTQKKKWVSTANSVYKDCMKAGDDKTCAAKAIKIANSQFSEEGAMGDLQKVPYGALRLVSTDCHAMVDESEDKRRLQMTVYNGGVIKDHWWWGDLAIDISGLKFDRSKYPILENHRTDRKIGFSARPITKNGKVELDPRTSEFVDTEASQEFQKTSMAGFPYQASMYAIPSVIERVEKNASVDVNGFKFKGPGTVWRRCLYQEASVCVFGWDKETESKAFSKEEVEIEYETKEVKDESQKQQFIDHNNLKGGEEVSEVPITLDQLQKDAPDLLKQVQDAATADAEAKFKVEREAFQGEIATLKGDKTALGDRVSKLEKAEIKRKDSEQLAVADAIWEAQFDASDISGKRRDKIKLHVKVKDYLDDNGRLDTVKFTDAVIAEIKDWETDEPTVLGAGGGFSRETDSEGRKRQKLADENKGKTSELLKLAGQPQKA